MCTANKRAGHVAQRELVARVSLAAQVGLVQKLHRLSQRRSGRLAAGQVYRLFCLARDIMWGMHGGHNYGDGARLFMHAAFGGMRVL